MHHRATAILLCSLVILSAITGCGGPPRIRTPFLQSVDLVEMTDRMAESFVASEVISARSADDPPWVISISRVVNHTNQIIPDREKWLYIGQLRGMLARSDVARSRSLIWIVPPERWPDIARAMNADITGEPFGLRMTPTHVLTAQFNALTTTSAAGRSDAYLCAFELLELDTGRMTWQDAWEVKRAVSGLTYD
jgi:hypothetical protein